MGLLFQLSLRNLLRQKRRNLLLGIGISFGMMILVIANSFSHGMVDVLINDIVSNAFGHLVIQSSIGNSSYYSMIRDKARIMEIVHDSIKKEDLRYVSESLGMFGQAVGNGTSDNVVVVGVSVKTEAEKKEFFKNFFTLVEGNFDDYFRKDIEYPIIISQEKAKSLNVKLHDDIRVRLPMVTGQINTAKLNVIAIANANNSFMNLILFMDGDKAKKLMGYKPWESAGLQLTLNNPEINAKKYANILYPKLKPKLISMVGKIPHEGLAPQDCRLLAFKNDDHSKRILSKYIRIVQGNLEDGFAKDGVMLSQQLAQKLHLNIGNEFHYQYQTKFMGMHDETFTVKAIYVPSNTRSKLGGNVVLINGEKVYDFFGRYLPLKNNWQYIDGSDSLYPLMATEWKLLPRAKDSESLQKINKVERKVRTTQLKMSVVTMYEGASDILKIEGVLNLITIIAVLVLFFIILIGVVNTLRMTIKERTREIGTTRAIGMQKKDVRNEFILETLFLTFFSCLVGIIAGILVMQALSLITFDTSSALSMILKNKHLYFKLAPAGIIGNLILILAITGITAYFPAKRAANLSAVEALRHFE
jgi:ABC-type lipoprotein release transport system permease subunit